MNSKAKGKRGELQAAAYLRRLGFTARRGVQYRGDPDAPDLIVSDLPRVHLEIKRRETLDIGTAELDQAMTQANADAGLREPVVLWRRNRTGWRLTWIEPGSGIQLTTCGDAEIAATLRRLNTDLEATP